MTTQEQIVEKKQQEEDQLQIEHLESNNLDADAQRLQDLGYKQEFKREISLFVQTGFSFSTMAVLPSWLSAFGSALTAGGPSSLFWGWVVVAPFALSIALSMSEVISAYPLAGGVYSWSLLLSNKKWGRFMAWITGYAYLIGLVTASITLAYTSADFIYGIANIMNVKQVKSTGAYVGLYIGLIAFGTFYNMLGMRYSAYMNKFMVFWVGLGGLLIIICVPAMAPSHNSAKWVFTEFINRTGYDSNGLAFFLGMLNAGWALVGYECGAQIVEGTKNAAVTAPRGIIICIISAIIQGFVLIISTLFSIQDLDELVESSMPVAIFFQRATNTSLSAFFLVVLLLAQIASLCNSMLAAAHLAWALARDGCLPFSKFFYKLSGKEHIASRCLLAQMVICIIIIMPIFGSEVYWEAIMSAAVISINVSYGLPLFCRLMWVRNDMPKGPFNLGKFSIPLNCIAVAWVIFFAVMLCIPSVHPVTAETMNWASVMIVGIMSLSVLFWFISGRKKTVTSIETPDDF